RNGNTLAMPALLTSTSQRPWRCSSSAKARATDSAAPTSMACVSAWELRALVRGVGGAEQRVRPRACAILRGVVEGPQREAKAARIAAHFVERCEPVIDVEARVLHALRHDRRGELLETAEE